MIIKWCLKWIWLISAIVPWRLRREWRQEWEAEIGNHAAVLRQSGGGTADRFELAFRCFGAIFDAFWLLRHEWRLEMLVQDIRYAAKVLTMRPSFAVVVILVLAVVIGANTAVFSVLKAVVLEPLPYEASDRLVRLWDANVRQNKTRVGPSPGNMLDWERENRVFDAVAAWYAGKPRTLDNDSQMEKIQVAQVTGRFFEVFERSPLLGRTLTPEDVERDEKVTVISYGLWVRRFGADPAVLGRTVGLDGAAHRILGVMPPDFRIPHKDAELWLPWNFRIAYARLAAIPRDFRFLEMAARMKPGVSLEEAQTEMNDIALRLAAQHPGVNEGWSVEVVPFKDAVVGRFGYALYILLGAVGFVLLIACTNLASLTLARGAGRSREFAVRSALGASSSRLIRQILTESVILSIAGGLGGLFLAYRGVELLTTLAPSGLPRIDEVRVDPTVLGYNFAVSILAGLIFGLVPAIQGTRFNLANFLKDGGPGSGAGRRQLRLRQALVVTEIAMASALLVGAGLMIRSFGRVIAVDPGFDAANLLVVRVFPEEARFNAEQRRIYFAQVYEALRGLPGVEEVGATTGLPLNAFNNNPQRPYWREGEMRPAGNGQTAPLAMTSIGYFKTMGMTLVRGRDFSEADREDAPRVAIVNEAMARQQWNGENPVGKRLIIDYATLGVYPYEIIGMVNDIKRSGPKDTPGPEVYLAHSQVSYAQMNIVLRTSVEPMSLAAAVRREVLGIDRSQPVHSIATMEQLMAGAVAQDRFAMLLMATLAALALVLAISGIYGVVSYAVSERTQELGIRIAIGAGKGDLQKMILSQCAKLVGIGLIAGFALSMALSSTLSGLLYDVAPRDPAAFAIAPVLIVLTALAASYFPVRRALRIDPLTAIRNQ